MRAPATASDDGVLTDAQRQSLLRSPLVVEEKLDGANVWIQVDDVGRPHVGGRSGGASDRAGQLGRLRAWAFERAHRLAVGLKPGIVLYGEWLYLTHSLPYDRLPDYLVVVDVRRADGTFIDRRGRESLCSELELTTTPLVYEGRLGGLDALRELHGPSAFGSAPAEGFVVRRETGGDVIERAKWVAPGFRRKTDEEWRGQRRRNELGRPRSVAGRGATDG